MKSPSPYRLLNPNRARFPPPHVVQNHAPSLAPAKYFLDSDDRVDVVASKTFHGFFPVAANDMLVDGVLDDCAGVQSLQGHFTGHFTTV